MEVYLPGGLAVEVPCAIKTGTIAGSDALRPGDVADPMNALLGVRVLQLAHHHIVLATPKIGVSMSVRATLLLEHGEGTTNLWRYGRMVEHEAYVMLYWSASSSLFCSSSRTGYHSSLSILPGFFFSTVLRSHIDSDPL